MEETFIPLLLLLDNALEKLSEGTVERLVRRRYIKLDKYNPRIKMVTGRGRSYAMKHLPKFEEMWEKFSG